jgi:hypothetical protein
VSSPSGRAIYSRNLDLIPWSCRFSGTYYVFKFVCKFEGVVQQNFVFSVYLSMWWNEGNSQNYKQSFRVHISATVCSKSSQVSQQNFHECCEQATQRCVFKVFYPKFSVHKVILSVSLVYIFSVYLSMWCLLWGLLCLWLPYLWLPTTNLWLLCIWKSLRIYNLLFVQSRVLYLIIILVKCPQYTLQY